MRDSKSGPKELLLADNEVGQKTRHDDGTNFPDPNFALLVQCLGFNQGFDFRLETEKRRQNTEGF